MVFRSRKKQIIKILNFKISDKKINTCNNVKFLGITLAENLHFNLQLNLFKSEITRAIGLLCKVRESVPKFLLKTLYYTIFHSHVTYTCQIWDRNFNALTKI